MSTDVDTVAKDKKKKSPTIEYNGDYYLRIPIRTHLITEEDNIIDVVSKYTEDVAEKDDFVVISESAAAITQGRAVLLDSIQPSFLARFLCRFVKKVSYGIGLGSPETMEMAIRETGVIRILFAAAVGAIGKLLGRSGDFYRVAGMQAALIDGAAEYVIPPYNKYVILGPKEPKKMADDIKKATGLETAIVDVNDIGGSWAIGVSDGLDKTLVEQVLMDNPLGQSDEQTPIGLVRLVEKEGLETVE
ncbi:MAG TPA: hypothetical protein GX526_03825 [Thermoanaerobacterales bacterium]|nr:hypothetical protein [Thermoanaerobacterales bacterium]